MKHQCRFLLFFFSLILVFPSLAGAGGETNNATEGLIRGSAAIGTGPGLETYTIVLSTASPLIDTGIDIEKGFFITIAARVDESHPPRDGNPDLPPARKPYDIIRNGTYGENLPAVIGKINKTNGKKEIVIPVGEKAALVSKESGRLFIGFNDCDGCYGDNTGAFIIDIAIAR